MVKSSSNTHSSTLDPSFFTGFVQGNGCFHIGLHADKKAKRQITIKPTFYVTQPNTPDKKISPILRLSRDLLQTGYYVEDKKTNCTSLCVNTLKQLKNHVLPHFDKYHLSSRKKELYLLFESIVNKMVKKEHHTEKGFIELLKAVLPLADNQYGKMILHHPVMLDPSSLTRNDTDTKSFSFTLKRVQTPVSDNPALGVVKQRVVMECDTVNGSFISGLFQGDGSFGFSFRTRKNKDHKKRGKVSPFFTIGQSQASKDLLEDVQRFFKCGKIYQVSDNYYRWMVSDYHSLKNNICNHFKNHPLLDEKGERFRAFEECLQILSSSDMSMEERIHTIVERAYDNNTGGNDKSKWCRRRLSKSEYLRAITS